MIPHKWETGGQKGLEQQQTWNSQTMEATYAGRLQGSLKSTQPVNKEVDGSNST